MRNLKKVLALTLVFALVLSLSVSAFAATYPDQGAIDGKYTNAVEILSQLNVIKGDESGKINPTGSFTRAEAAKIVTDTYLGGNGEAAAAYAAAPTSVYSDVPTSAWYAGAAYFMQYMGVMTHTGAGLFEPNKEISRIEVAGLVLGLVGYDNEKQGYSNNAQWKLNIQRDASFVHLYDDISSSTESITRQEVFQMVVNGLMTESIIYNPATGLSEFSDTKTVLNVRFPNYEQIEGQLVSNKYAAVDNGTAGKVVIAVKNGRATIENISDAVAPVAMLGKEVRLFAKKTTTSNLYNGALGVCTDLSSTTDLLDNDDAIKAATTVYVNYEAKSSKVADGGNAKAYPINDGIYTEAYGVRSNEAGVTYTGIYANLYSLVKVTAVTGGKVTATRFNSSTKVINAVAAADFENGTTLAVGDVAMVLMQGTTPITATVVAPQTGVLSSVTNDKVTLSGTQYSVLTSIVKFRDSDEMLTGSIVGASDNFGVSNTFYLFNGKLLEYVGAASSDDFAVVVAFDEAGIGMGSVAKVKLLKDNNTTGIYTLKKLSYSGGSKDGDKVKQNISGARVAGEIKVASAVDNSAYALAGSTAYSYVVNSDGTVSLTEVDGTNATTGMDTGAVASGQFSYSKGASSMKVANNATYTVNADTRTYVYDAKGDKYYAFIGKTLPDTSSVVDSARYIRDGAVLKHVVLTATDFKSNVADGDKGYVINATLTGSGATGYITLEMLNIDTGEVGTYTVQTNRYYEDEDLVDVGAGAVRTYLRKHIIEFNQDANGTITYFERTELNDLARIANSATSTSMALTAVDVNGNAIGSDYAYDADIIVVDTRDDSYAVSNTNIMGDTFVAGTATAGNRTAFEARYHESSAGIIDYLVITDEVNVTVAP